MKITTIVTARIERADGSTTEITEIETESVGDNPRFTPNEVDRLIDVTKSALMDRLGEPFDALTDLLKRCEKFLATGGCTEYGMPGAREVQNKVVRLVRELNSHERGATDDERDKIHAMKQRIAEEHFGIAPQEV